MTLSGRFLNFTHYNVISDTTIIPTHQFLYNNFNRRALQFIIEGGNYMDYLMNGIIIVFVLACIVFFYNALKIQHGSKNFPTPKEESKDGPLDEIEDEYQRYAEEELEKNKKEESGKE